MARGRALLHLAAVAAACLAHATVVTAQTADWTSGSATFYGGVNASGTMGGACGYGDLYSAGYGTSNVALSIVLFNDGAACGECYQVLCDASNSQWCRPGVSVTVTATNFCPPDNSKPIDAGGWCNAPRKHLAMAQPAWEKITVYETNIVPILFQRVRCYRTGGVRITITGFNYFELVLITNMAGSGSIKSISVKGTSTAWVQMTKNWGANWLCNAMLTGLGLSFSITSTGGQNIAFQNVVPAWWRFGQTFTTNYQFNY